MLSASPSASSSAAATHWQLRWTSPQATPLLPMTTMLSTLSSLRPQPRTKTRMSARWWHSKARASAYSQTVLLPPTSHCHRRRLLPSRCTPPPCFTLLPPPLTPPCCRQRRAVALPPPPQPPRCCHHVAVISLCADAVLHATATAADANTTALPQVLCYSLRSSFL